ncbi:MAG: serine protease [bacterium]
MTIKISIIKTLQFLFTMWIILFHSIMSLSQDKEKKDIPEMPAEIYNRLSPVTVKIICEGGETEGSGSIVGITNKGLVLILTTCHVVSTNFNDPDQDLPLEFYKDINVKIETELTLIQAIVLPRFVDRANDLAFIVTRKSVSEDRVISYTRSDKVKPGQRVAALGFPKTDELSQTLGTIDRLEGNYLIFNAEIAPGSSGGPLIDKYGRMIGLSTFTEENEGYAIHMNLVSSVVNGWLDKIKLKKKWKHKRYTKFYQDPKVFVPGLSLIAAIIATPIVKGNGKGALIFGKPPLPPGTNEN